MSSSKSRYLAVSSGHVDALISYVLDAKPYHTKLSEIVERYDMDDTVNVKILDEHRLVAFLGADLLEANSTSNGIRSKRSNSWMKDLIADGSRRTWELPLTSVHKFLSHSNQERFVAGVDDNFQIPGFQTSPTSKAFNPRRWDGPSISNVRKQGNHQQESIDYFLSHGAYSFDVTATPERWKEHNIRNVSAFAEHNGSLFYQDVQKPYGTITDIGRGAYDEWTLTCVNETTQTLSVVGQINGNIGTVDFGDTFDHPLLTFTFSPAPEEADSFMSVGDTFVLTPFHKVTVHPSAVQQTWSIIKTNPIGLLSKPSFTAASTAPARLFTPYMEVHTRSIDRCDEQTVWRVQFTSPTQYTLRKISASESYTVSDISLVDGCSFKNDDIHFTIFPTLEGFVAGDAFDFSVSERIENFLVYGSVSGWTANAKQGEWYWNGQIGFKIPSLKYFARVFTSAIFMSDDASIEGWQPSLTSANTFKSIFFDDGFYALGENDEIQFSENGYLWSEDLPLRSTASRLLFVTKEDDSVLSSTDGVNWTRASTNVGENLNDILTYQLPSSSVIATFIVGDRGTILRSTDGINWTQQTSGTLQNLTGVSRRNNRVVVCGDGGFVATSTNNGATWIPIVIPNSVFGSLTQSQVDFTDIKHILPANKFVMTGSNGVILTSTDGLNWVRPQFSWDGPSRDTGTFSYIAHSSTHIVVTSVEGWVASAPMPGNEWTRYLDVQLKSIVFGGGKFVALGATTIPLNMFVELKSVHSMAEPSVYTIEFQQPINPSDPVRHATVVNNIYGYRRALTVNEDWSDEFCSFRLEDIPGQFEYEAGDVIKVFIAPEYKYGGAGWYDEHDYELPLYDTGLVEKSRPWLYNEEYYPLYHGHGLVIFRNNISNGDRLVIDKALTDVVRLRITNSNLLYPELAAVNDWIPLEFRMFDNTGSTATNYSGSTAHFPDLTTTIEAYLASDPTVKVFTIRQPRYLCSNKSASAIITIDNSFVSNFLPVNTNFTIRVSPDSNYGQKLRVKITENLRAYARVRLNLEDVFAISIADAPVFSIGLIFDDSASISFIEAGALPIAYDEDLYDVSAYDIRAVVIPQSVQISPGVYDYTGNMEDWVIPKPTSTPGIYVEDRPNDVAGTSFVEGLTITSTSLSNEVDYHVFYNFDTAPLSGLVITQDADRFVVTVNDTLTSTPDVYIESMDGLTGAFVPVQMTPIANSTVTSVNAFSFEMPESGGNPLLTAPFRLRVTQ